MSISIAITIIILISNLLLGLLVYKNNPINKINRLFLLLILTANFWIVCNFLQNTIPNIQLAIFSLKLDFASAAFLVYFFLLFCIYFPKDEGIYFKNLLIRNLLISIPPIFFAIISFSYLVIKDINFLPYGVSYKTSPLFEMYVFLSLLISVLDVIACLENTIIIREIDQ